MGNIIFGSTQAYNKSVQKTQSSISQISNQKCLNICSQESSGNLIVRNSDINNLTDIQRCNVSGASCILKSSLSASIVDDQTSNQKAKLGFGTIGDGNLSNDNYQSIATNISQFVNETCGNRSEQNTTGSTVLDGVKANNVILGQLGNDGHSGCVLNNMSRALTNTSQKNSQSAVREGLGGILGTILTILFIGGFIWLFMHLHKSHTIATTPSGNSKGNTTINETTNITVENVTEAKTSSDQKFMSPGQQNEYKAHIDGFKTGAYVVLFFSLVSLGASVYFFMESYTSKKECYGKVSNGAPRPTSTNSFGAAGCTTGNEPECYVPLLPDGSRAYDPFE